MKIYRKYGQGRHFLLGVGLLIMILAGACQPITAERATLPWKADMEQDVSSSALDELSESEAVLVVRAAEDLAETLGVDVADVTLVSIEAVDWPDASLGCPEPDMMYAAMLTPGYRIVLSADEIEYEYHTSDNPDSRLAQCESDQ